MMILMNIFLEKVVINCFNISASIMIENQYESSGNSASENEGEEEKKSC